MQLPDIMDHKEASLCKHLKLILYQTLVKVSFDLHSEVKHIPSPRQYAH